MASNFSANQRVAYIIKDLNDTSKKQVKPNYDHYFVSKYYEKAFHPTKLCNWEVPKKSTIVPRRRLDVTHIIANDRGHLLPGIRKLNKNPWAGLYQGTYQLPAQINQKLENEMRQQKDILSWGKRSSHVPVISPTQSTVLANKENKDYSISYANKENKLIADDQVPSSRNTEPNQDSNRTGSHSSSSTKSGNILHDIKNHEKTPDLSEKPSELLDTKSNLIVTDSLLHSNAYCNELIARNLKLNNQKHHTLADAIENNSYTALQMKRVSNPGLSLNVEPSTTAVGCKIFQSPGPTQCSKLKVFRPKTATDTEKVVKYENDNRPKTTSRIRKQTKPLSGMDLAIYWDISNGNQNIAPIACTPRRQNDQSDVKIPSPVVVESNRSVDNNEAEKLQLKSENETNLLIADTNRSKPPSTAGSNRSYRSSSNHNVATLVSQNSDTKRTSTPEQENKEITKQKWKRESLLIKRNIIGDEKPEISESKSEIESYNNNKNETRLNARERFSKSTPNLADIGIQVNCTNLKTKFPSRPCIACDVKRIEPYRSDKNSDKYKMAFKAGKLNNFTIDSTAIERIQKARNLRVPKPKIPFAKKSYSIGTLFPPFSVWPGVTGQDYPDHWRLASVYQHSYKPLEARKIPLIKTIFL